MLCIVAAALGAAMVSAVFLLVFGFRIRAQRGLALHAFQVWTDTMTETLEFMEYRITQFKPSHGNVLADYLIGLICFYHPLEQFKTTFGNTHLLTLNLSAIIEFYEATYQPFYALINYDGYPTSQRLEKIQEFKDDIEALPIRNKLVESISLSAIVQELIGSCIAPSKAWTFREIESLEEWHVRYHGEQLGFPRPDDEKQVSEEDFEIAAD